MSKSNRVGTSGDHIIIVIVKNNVIVAHYGNDLINATIGDDVVCGGNGDDKINGGDGDERVLGDSFVCKGEQGPGSGLENDTTTGDP